jgi:hypothetical protein
MRGKAARAICGVVLVVLGLACTASQSVSIRASNRIALPSGTYAYLADEAMVLMDGDHQVARRVGQFKFTSPFTWTMNGRFVVAISGDLLDFKNLDHRSIVIMDALTGQVTEADCYGCTSVAAIDDHRILVGQMPIEDDFSAKIYYKMLEFDLTSTQSPVASQIRFPEAARDFELYTSGASGVAFASITPQKATRSRTLYLVHEDGSVQAVGESSGSTGVSVARANVRSSDQVTIALGTGSALQVDSSTFSTCVFNQQVVVVRDKPSAVNVPAGVIQIDSSAVVPYSHLPTQPTSLSALVAHKSSRRS